MNSKHFEISFLVPKGEQLHTTICVSLPFARVNGKIFIPCQVLIPLPFLSSDVGIFASKTGEINFLTVTAKRDQSITLYERMIPNYY